MTDRPVLVLQARPETAAADEEYASIVTRGGLDPARCRRVRLERDDPAGLDPGDFAAVILGGGPACISDPVQGQSPAEARINAAILPIAAEIVARDLPFLGCCYGIGVMGHVLGAPVGKGRFGEPVGLADCGLTEAGRADPVLEGLPDRFPAFVGHKEAVEALPSGCRHLVESPTCPYQMIRFGQNVYATQFHPEADAESFALRIRLYRERGYFAPGEAERLIALCAAAEVVWPKVILANFVARYCG
ncbi:GMP synthase (glutamine-hydrolysing) [Palleronia aestuarii]|uniref:GMP synthase (Glutamine-hydrolysing) n=1 Tax=Palleronia aestuarii TaxID=568105 RepID=A0A2W7NB57_9RHOB|nr:glutamine amidotransferase [Palleronia aestuarii]PZX17655.1 GMP synthase (glutamine-hydrolysing) [Palleronia aestuarii]